MQKNFAITGTGGFIAPRHLKAIKDTGHRLLAAVDPKDSVGVLDQYFDEARFFTEFERFDRYVEKLRRTRNPAQQVDYLSICSPNYLHDAHIRFALRVKADAICEKPLVLNPWNLDALKELEQESGKNIYTVLQLRLHPSLTALKENLARDSAAGGKKIRNIRLTYVTSRGPWYLVSWKGQLEKSGGLATNIGIHFFDMLIWLFGPATRSIVHYAHPLRTGGLIELQGARVQWFLSIDKHDLPSEQAAGGKRTFRSIALDGEEVEFSEGFTDLHTRVYQEILAGRGFCLEDSRPSIELAHQIRNAAPAGMMGDYHPFLQRYKG